MTFDSGAEVIVKRNSVQILPVFYISRPDYGNGYAEITAYDMCRRLDMIFDTSGAFSEEKSYPVHSITAAIASQCGFSSADGSDMNVGEIPYKLLYGRTCREILCTVSQCGCGMWHCRNDGSLYFQRLETLGEMYTIKKGEYSEFRPGAKKGPIKCVSAYDQLTGKRFVSGSGDYLYTLKLSGKLMSQNIADKILGSVGNYVYRGFKCGNIMTDSIPDALCGFSFDGNIFRAVKQVTYFTPFGYLTDASAPNISEDRFDYIGAVSNELMNRIMQEKLYGGSMISYNGLKMVYREEEE